jgi:hypothetical protein
MQKIIIRSLLGFGLLFCSVINTNAQQKPFKFGFKVAPGISWLGPDAKEYESGGAAFTFAWGFVSDFTLMDNYYVSTGFNMSYFKGKLKYPHTFDNYSGNLERTYNLRYIEVPVALKMKTNELVDNFSFFGLIGINTGFKIRAKANESFYGSHDIATVMHSYSENQVDISNETATVKASLLVGAGTEYVVDESVSIFVGINFNNGFTNVLKGTNTANDVEARAIPYYFELNLGVIF